MSAPNRTYRLIPVMTAVAAVILFTLSFFWDRSDGITEAIARHAGQKTEKRIEILERYADRIISDSGHNSCLDDLPEDMVIYKYVNDSLVSWSNQFPLLNDDISNRLVFQRLTNLKSRITSPLTDVTDEYSYMNLGPKWYIVKEITGANNERIIAGVVIFLIPVLIDLMMGLADIVWAGTGYTSCGL